MDDKAEAEDVTHVESTAKSDVEKRERKLTAKGVMLLLENLQKNRKLNLNKASKIKQQIRNLLPLKITRGIVCSVEELLSEFKGVMMLLTPTGHCWKFHCLKKNMKGNKLGMNRKVKQMMISCMM